MSNTIKLKRGSGSDPGSSDLSVGEVALRTDNGKLFTKKDDGSVAQIGGGAGAIDDGAVTNAKVASDAAIAGSKIDPSFTSGITVSNTSPKIELIDTDNNSDFQIKNEHGQFRIRDLTHSINRLTIASDGTADVTGNLNVGAGIDVTGNITATGALDVVGITIGGNTPSLNFTDANDNPDFRFLVNSNSFILEDTTNSANRFVVNSDGHVDIAGNVDFGAGIDVTGNITATGNINLSDSSGGGNNRLIFGGGDDLQLWHDGSNSYIADEGTGQLRLSSNAFRVNNAANDESMIAADENGAVELYHDNSKKFETTSSGAGVTGNLEVGSGQITCGVHGTTGIQIINDGTFGTLQSADLTLRTASTTRATIDTSGNFNIPNDTGKIRLGTGNDLQIYHDGTENFINSENGNIRIRNSAEDMMKLIPNGAVELYHDNSKKFETTSAGVSVTGTCTLSSHLLLGDGDEIKVGSGEDLLIFHNGTDSFLLNATGEFQIANSGSGNTIFLQAKAGENSVRALANGAVELYHDNSKKFETKDYGAFINGHLQMDDNSIIKLGNSNDLQIYHTGSNSIIQDTGTGDLIIKTNIFRVRGTNDEPIITGSEDGNVALYHDNSKKFETVSDGAHMTRELRIVGTSVNDFESGRVRFTEKDNALLGGYIHYDGNPNILKIGVHPSSDSTVGNDVDSIEMNRASGSENVELNFSGTKKFETTSAGVTVSGNISVSGTVDGRDVASDGSKLDSIESGATADQSASEILTLIKTVDGSGSGLDADTLDGANSSVSASNGTIVQRHSSGYIFANYINTTDNSVSSSVSGIICKQGDSYHRTATAAAVRSFLNVADGANNITNNNQLSNGAGYITSGSNRAAQAYVNFTGDGTPSIRDDVNVSSIGDNGTGLYTVNFSSSMPNSSYCVSTGFANSGNSNVCKVVEDSLSTGSFQLRCGSYQDGSGNTNRDFHSVYCSIFAG